MPQTHHLNNTPGGAELRRLGAANLGDTPNLVSEELARRLHMHGEAAEPQELPVKVQLAHNRFGPNPSLILPVRRAADPLIGLELTATNAPRRRRDLPRPVGRTVRESYDLPSSYRKVT